MNMFIEKINRYELPQLKEFLALETLSENF